MRSFYQFYQKMLQEQQPVAPAPVPGQQASGTAPAVPPVDPNLQRASVTMKQLEPLMRNIKNPQVQQAFQALNTAMTQSQQPQKPVTPQQPQNAAPQVQNPTNPTGTVNTQPAPMAGQVQR